MKDRQTPARTRFMFRRRRRGTSCSGSQPGFSSSPDPVDGAGGPEPRGLRPRGLSRDSHRKDHRFRKPTHQSRRDLARTPGCSPEISWTWLWSGKANGICEPWNFWVRCKSFPMPILTRALSILEVAVTDAWPWVGAVIPSFAGGQREVAVVVANGNLRGRGQEAGFFAFLSNEVSDSYSFFFREPRSLCIAMDRSAFRVGRQGNVGNQNGVEISRPFYSLSTPWSYDISVFDETSERILYSSGVATSDYFRTRRGVSLGGSPEFPERGPAMGNGSALYTYRDDEHQQETGWSGVLPEDKERGRIVFEVLGEKFRFAEDRFINQMGQIEDQRLGVPRIPASWRDGWIPGFRSQLSGNWGRVSRTRGNSWLGVCSRRDRCERALR